MTRVEVYLTDHPPVAFHLMRSDTEIQNILHPPRSLATDCSDFLLAVLVASTLVTV